MADLERVAIRTERKLDEIKTLIEQQAATPLPDLAKVFADIAARLEAIEALVAKPQSTKK
jgi:predicted metal-dependent enzyme (double-stranded beta helix superfamily)